MSEFNSTKKTNLVYLNDTYSFEIKSKITQIGNDQKGNYFVTEDTVFYPQGGGQPSDTGCVQINDSLTLNVTFVSIVDGIVHHYFEANCLENDLIGKEVLLKVDGEKRLKHAKCHTSGHLMGCITEVLAPELTAVKGHHFLDGPYVEFDGKLSSIDSNKLNDLLNQKLDECIKAGAKVTAIEITVDEYNKIMADAGKPVAKPMPNIDKLRVVTIENYLGVPCGGTHLNNVSEIKSVTIRKIQSQKGKTKIGYTCE